MPGLSDFYFQYMHSAAWRSIRRKALERDKYLCQVCKKKLATQVHHLTYERFGHELLVDLLSSCRSCHGILSRLGIPRPNIYEISTAPDLEQIISDT